MPAKEQHIECATFNESFAHKVHALGPEYLGWAIVALFYSALHLVNAYIVLALNKHPRSHKKRSTLMSANPILKQVYIDYSDLRACCDNSRYDAVKLTQTDFDDSIQSLARIKDILNPKLSSPPAKSPDTPK